MNFKTPAQYQSGIGIIEIIVGTGIISLSLIGIIVAFQLHFQSAIRNTQKIQAVYLLEEGVEAVRFLRDSGWSVYILPLSIGTQYYPEFNGSLWEAKLAPVPAYIDGVFERTFVFADVYRDDVSSDIVAPILNGSPGTTLDPEIRELSVSVSWHNGSATSTESVQTYLTNVFNF